MSTMKIMSETDFITNENGNTLENKFKKNLKETRFFDILVGYFRMSGFNKVFSDFENIEKIICVSDVVKNDIISKYPNLKSKCEVIENYLDVQEILQSSMKQVDFKVDSERLNIISISRVSKEKRI